MDQKLQDILSKLKTYQGEPPKNEHLFETEYGYFQNRGREYVIKTPHTPALWANFLTNGQYTALVTPTGGGYSWYRESGFNRILREHPLRHLLEDTPGRYVYIQDTKTRDFWSATYQPVKKADNFLATHSLGYTKSETTYQNIHSAITYFVPQGKSYEMWWMTLENTSKKTRTLTLYSYAELVLGAYQPDIMENAFNSLFSRGREKSNALIFEKSTLLTRDNLVDALYDKIGFFTTSEKIQSYELSKSDFVGFGNSLQQPQALYKGKKLSSCARSGENLIGCVSFTITLKPGEKKDIFFALGLAKNEQEVQTVTNDLTKKSVTGKLAAITDFWDDYVKKVWIQTPDKGLDIWFNYWLKYQLHFNGHWSEMDSFYIGGGGGFGFRDTAQHIWGILPFEKEVYMRHLRFLLQHQYPHGAVPHGILMYNNTPINSPHSDDPCWLVFAVLNYIEESGDLDFLEEQIPFAPHDGDDNEDASVLKHLIRATDFSLRNMSERGIPQLMIGDWNDALSGGRLGKGESFLVAGLLAYNLKRIVALCRKLKRYDRVEEYEFAYKRLAESVSTFGWDGEWFLRATRDHQKLPIGSAQNERGKLYLDSNTWLCISGMAGVYTKKTLDSLWEYLMTKYGAQLFSPAYKTQDKELGVISQFVEGSKENAAIFLHANAWFMIALSLGGQSSRVVELLRRINPVYQSFTQPETYRVEPYVLPEFIFGNESDKFGQGSFTWVTGSAEWFFRGILDFFLGLKPNYDHLEFEPQTPQDWDFVVEREFAGKRFRAEYKKGKKTLVEIKKTS